METIEFIKPFFSKEFLLIQGYFAQNGINLLSSLEAQGYKKSLLFSIEKRTDNDFKRCQTHRNLLI